MKNKIIHITTGDIHGIGDEITLKALRRLKGGENVSFKIWRSSASKKYPKFSNLNIEERRINKDPVSWVNQASKEILKSGGSLVTGPLSKETIKKSGSMAIGHNGLLKAYSNGEPLFMLFIGKHFNVLLGTGHIPLNLAERDLLRNTKLILRAAENSKQFLKGSLKNKPLGFLGFNPHAGENGLLGDTEKYLSKFLFNSENILGPLVPDVAFQKQNWKKYSLYVCCYHDQGLIPFKLVHGQSSGIQVSVGLPFLRVSVDHGIAKDIYGQNIANEGSMVDAIEFAIKHSREKTCINK